MNRESEKKMIFSFLRKVSRLFPDTEFRYQFDAFSDTYLIHVLPLEFYNNNSKYIYMESDFVEAFTKSHTFGSILFISDESLTRLDKIEKIFKNKKK